MSAYEIGLVCKDVEGEVTYYLETRDEDSDERYARMFEVWTQKSLDEVRNSVFRHFERTHCGHSYDCCGCFFRSSVRVVPMYEKENVAYYIVDYWARNI